jgi:anti-anti-sigma factor
MSSTAGAGQLTALDVLAASLEDLAAGATLYAADGAVVVGAPENFDIYSAPAFRELLIRLHGAGVTRVVIDLAGTAAILDSTPLGVIVAAHKRFAGAGGWLAVAGAASPVNRMFTVTNVASIVPMYPTAAEALAAARALPA